MVKGYLQFRKGKERPRQVFACEICQTHYDHKANAEKCENLPKWPILRAGDKVRLVNLDFIEYEDATKKRLIGEIGKILPRIEYHLENNRHVPYYFVAFDNAETNDDFPYLLSKGTVPIPRKSLERIVEDKTPQQ